MTTLFGDIVSDAVISDCGTYRYELSRRWSDGPEVLWVMLNPSTADASVDDPTIRRCIGFTKQWGYSALRVINLFALRATDPRELLRHPDPFGPDNAAVHVRYAYEAPLVVVAWGADKAVAKGAASVQKMYEARGAMCLGRTKAEHPRHPLYVPADKPLEPWRSPCG